MTMLRRASVLGVCVATATMVGMLALAAPAEAQPARERGERPERGGDREAWAERMRERMAERQQEQMRALQERLAMNENEFAVVGPMITKAQSYAREAALTAAAPMMALGARRGGRPGAGERPFGPPPGGLGGPAGPGGPGGPGAMGGPGAWGMTLSEEGQQVQQTVSKLRDLLQAEEHSADDLKAAMAQTRAARQAHRAARVKAQEELQSVLTTEQEAILLAMGVIE